MKKLFITALLATAAIAGHAQLGTPMALYSGNQIVYNPGYAGIYDLLAINVSFQKSWSGLPGSPDVINLNGHAPFKNQKHAFGWVYQRESWGNLAGHSVSGNYAYKVYFSESLLNLGLQAGVLHNAIDWSKIDREFIESPDEYSELYNQARVTSVKFDVTVGAYYLAKDWYAGLSAAHLTSPRYGKLTDESTGEPSYFKMNVQYYLMAGYHFDFNETWSIQPEVFSRYVYESPFTFDFGAYLCYTSNYAVGMSYRTGQNTLNFNFKIGFSDDLRLCFSYGVPTGAIRPYQKGNYEISLNYSSKAWMSADRTVDLIWL